MAKKKDENRIKISPIRKMANRVQDTSNSLYRSTYYTNPTNKQQLKSIKTDINKSIRDIIDTNYDNTGQANISKLYERLLMNSDKDGDGVYDELNSIFGDTEFINNIANSYIDNRWVKLKNLEIDETIKYMPKLEEALQTIKDNVLSSDSFSKDFLNIENSIENTTNHEQFSRNIEQLKEKYNLLKLTDETYYDTGKYGEKFIYCVPYQKAIQTLMNRKVNTTINVKTNLQEGTVMLESEIDSETFFTEKVNPNKDEYNDLSFTVEFCDGYIESFIQDAKKVRDIYSSVQEQSLCEQYFNENAVNEAKLNDVFNYDIDQNEPKPRHNRFTKTIEDDLEYHELDDFTASDGFIDSDNAFKKNTKINEMNGAIVKELNPEQVLPIMIDKINLGYYYFEYNNGQDMLDDRYQSTGLVNTINGLRSNGRDESFDAMQRREELLKQVSDKIASRIDTKFINDNQDLKKEIYHILKYSDDYQAATLSEGGIRVSYIPPEDIHHFYFKLDKNTGRGISDLELSMIPAKLYVAIYITNCLAVMTRGNDKRVYYVKQSVESNISKTLLKTINEIKKSNFGIRQVQSINNVLNITGRFNDYIIPRGADGQSPIDLEVIQGQQIEIKSELLNILEESAINVTGVPIEIIQNRQSPDYAIQLTMSNSKFLRFVYSRQSDFQKQLSRLLTKIYDIEYNTTDKVSVTLPPPLFINITNTNQLVTNVNDYSDQLVNIIAGDEQDETVRAILSKKIKLYHLGSYVNMDVLNNLYNEARQESTKTKLGTEEEQ